MAKIQCKMCGGTLDLQEGVLSGTCNYCGNVVTFPKISDEQYENLYNRAEHFRRINEYDKAVAAYEKIVEINSDDAEAYWGLVLSRYGIEYVEDPVSHERIPTCHRVQYDSILADADYLAALEHAGSYEKGLYEAEAKRISEIQKGILAISSQEEPFDVFICYKESDDMGRRTHDSVVAQEIYYELTEAGYKVFFARITLESKIGQQYEPYIFAALNSAKAMLVIGSKKEFFEAVWVKNEWSRYLALIKKDRKKLLIPCYRDMDAYDIPEELSMFQAQDMSKIGFMQDILHGIKKTTNTKETVNKPKENTNKTLTQTGKDNPLLRRVKLFVESGDFESALEYCNRVLDSEPENGWAHFANFLASNEWSDEETFYKIPNFQNNNSFKFSLRFADDELKEKIKNALQRFEDERKRAEEIKRRQEAERQMRVWIDTSTKILERYADAWSSLNLDAEVLKKIQDRIEQNRKASIFDVEQHKQATQNLISSLGNIIDLENKVFEKQQFRKIAIIIGIIALIITIFVSIGVYTSSAPYQYKTAKEYYEKGEYYQAVKYFEKAVAQGHIEAQYNLGVCYYNGYGVTKDMTEAIKWYRKAAEQGHSEAKKQLESEEIKRYILATEKNDAKAQCDLGKYYFKQKDDANAILWLKKSAYQGYAESQYVLGKYYFNKGDYKQAVVLLEKASSNNHKQAKELLGICIAIKQGMRFSKDYKTLVKCNNKNITECVIPDGVTTIGEEVFDWCKNLRSVTIPDSVTTIGENAFRGCSNLQSVTIPNSVTTIGDAAFWGVKNVNISSTHPYFYKDSAGALISKKDKKIIWFPPEYSGSYTIPDSVTTIGDWAFLGCKNLQSVIIPNSVTIIGASAFCGCINLQSVTIGNSVTTIGDWAFHNCWKLKEVRVPNNCKIGTLAFPSGCKVIEY